MDWDRAFDLTATRRQLFGKTATGIGVAAGVAIFQQKAQATAFGALPDLPHFPPKAKRVIFLHQSGGPSQLDLFDYKPKLMENRGKDLPASIRMGQRITGMTS